MAFFRQTSLERGRNILLRATRRYHPPPKPPTTPTRPQKYARRAAYMVALSAGSVVAYDTWEPFRHTTLAVDRCTRLGVAVALGAIDYKRTLGRTYESKELEMEELSRCHKTSAERVLKVLQANGGIFIKFGQHISSVQLLPYEWTSTMRPLQDQCIPTPYEDVEYMFLMDTGKSVSELFSDFEQDPIGVASLAQVHRAVDRETGRRVAVKLQHPRLEEFARIDIATTSYLLSWISALFPEFEFSWLGEEMKENLTLEMDFNHEAANTARCAADFAHHHTTALYIPDVIRATKRTLVMEFIEGGRVDDLEYLAHHHIDRNRVSQELSRIFSEMVYINGFFHADPHAGNLLIRPAPPSSRSPFNFEIALLDHGLYFDIDDDLRINYAHLWLSLMAAPSAKTQADRRKYAKLVGNIGEDLYPVFESAITGRANLKAVEEASDTTSLGFSRAGSMLDAMPQTEEELEAIRRAVMQKDGLLISLFELLRRVPRRVLMILKLNDLTRNLDNALATTHPRARIFVIVARYCSLAAWRDDRSRALDTIKKNGVSWSLARDFLSKWWSFRFTYSGLKLVEITMDFQARIVMTRAWLRGLWRQGLAGAERAAAGLPVP